MRQDTDGLWDEIKKLAQVVELIENSFFSTNKLEITISLEDDKFNKLLSYLNHNTSDQKCIISIGNANFTFLKK